LRLWDLAAPVVTRDGLACGSGIYGLAVAPDGSFAVSGSEDGVVRIWDLLTATMKDLFAGHSGAVRAVALLPDTQHAISGAEEGDLRILDMLTGRPSRRIATGRGLIAQILPIDDERVLVAGAQGTIDLWNLKTESVCKGVDHHRETINSLVLMSDGTHVVSGSSDTDIRLWDLRSGRTLRVFKGHVGAIHAVQIFPNGQELLSGSADGELRRWNISTGETTRILAKVQLNRDPRRSYNLAPALLDLQLLPGAEFAILCCGDRTMRVWDLVADREVQRFVDDHSVDVCAMTADGASLLVGNQIGRLHRFRLKR
jgi:WD40 repeat protein